VQQGKERVKWKRTPAPNVDQGLSTIGQSDLIDQTYVVLCMCLDDFELEMIMLKVPALIIMLALAVFAAAHSGWCVCMLLNTSHCIRFRMV